jgi:hypothetical protein
MKGCKAEAKRRARRLPPIELDGFEKTEFFAAPANTIRKQNVVLDFPTSVPIFIRVPWECI